MVNMAAIASEVSQGLEVEDQLINDQYKSINEVKLLLMQLLNKPRKEQILKIGTSSGPSLSSNPQKDKQP